MENSFNDDDDDDDDRNNVESPFLDLDDVDEMIRTENNVILQHIVGYLTLSDAASVASGFGLDTPTDGSWTSSSRINHWNDSPSDRSRIRLPTTTTTTCVDTGSDTPPTPDLVALSPDDEGTDFFDDVGETLEDMKRQKRRWVQQKLATAIFSYPQSLREYCVDVHRAAVQVQRNDQIIPELSSSGESPETFIEPGTSDEEEENANHRERNMFIDAIIDHILSNVPLSVVLHVLEGFREVSLDTSFAVVRISTFTIHGVVDAILGLLSETWNAVKQFNPLHFFKTIVSHPFNAMGVTTEVVVSGIQSVATGVGSASSLALHRLSAKTASSSNLAGNQGSTWRTRSAAGNSLNEKLLKKLSSLHSAASVVSYTEIADDTGGLSRQAKSRVQRMMHYDISLRPFVATVKLPVRGDAPTFATDRFVSDNYGSDQADDPSSSASSSPLESPFMCTPQSFPPTPSSRRMVLARGTRFADDVIFLARDQLRVHDALDSENQRTREMAEALREGKRLAVFDADDASVGIDLTCGQHVAAKVGNMLYCSTRSMVPILRNCFVYFEMTVLPRAGTNLIPQVSMSTLSIGLSTKEMPPNTLVGAWKGSVGLCTTGQILTAGQWCSPVNPAMSSYGDQATVGCLVCLDDGSAFETWDGVIVTAAVTFNVNQRIVSPPVLSLPMTSTSTDGTVNTGNNNNNTDMNNNSSHSSHHNGMRSSTGNNAHAAVGTTSAEPMSHQPHHQHQHHQAPPFGIAPPSFTLSLLVPAEEELYPTVTLHSPGTAVMCRFSAADVLATSRELIGAPPGVTVYAADGSVILSS